MADRLRALLDHPLDPNSARAILVLASGIFLGLTALFVVAASQPDPPTPRNDVAPSSGSAPPASINPVDEFGGQAPAAPSASDLRQDPQDVKGSRAARRANRALRSHQALQHVPYRRGNLTISLVGAEGHRAVLRVSGPTRTAARRGWRAFLRRFHDRGEAYIARFVGRDAGARR